MVRKSCISVIVLITVGLLLSSCGSKQADKVEAANEVLKTIVLQQADEALGLKPETVTDFTCERSAGGVHDFYSEGDYWWPNPDDADGAYIRKDGETNPENFVAHRIAMIRFSKIVGSLASAYILTGDEAYVKHAFAHIKAWFVDEKTMMNPNLLYAQAIKGITIGRGIGIIDTIHLMEVAQGILRMQDATCVDQEELATVKLWFDSYINWLTTHPNGVAEMNAKNNHGTCWVMQVASFAKLTANEEVLDFCRTRYKTVLLPLQMAADGSFPLEMERTKPYGYALFNLDAMTAICQILSTSDDNLWTYDTPQGLSIAKGLEFMYPYIADKSTWMLPKDVMYDECWPVAQPALLFGALAYENEAYFNLWKNLEHNTFTVLEVERNLPIKYPIIWL